MSERKRLHPITTVSNALSQLKSMIIPLIGLLALGHKKESFGDFISVMIMGFAVIFVLISGLVKWLRFTYRFEDGELRIEYGFLIKKKRYIPFERIQSLSFSEGILQRPFGLVKVVFETAGSNLQKAEAELTAITRSEAALIERTINEAKGHKIVPVADELHEILHYKISTTDLLIMSSTSGGIGVIVSAVLALFSQLDDFIPYEKIYHEVGSLIHGGIVLIISFIIIGLMLAWGLSILITFFKYSNFTVSEHTNDLIISRGMLEKKKITIPLNRIQAIRVSESPLRALFGYASVYIESAGGNLEDKESRNITLLPLVKKKRFPSILSRFLKDYHFQVKLAKAPLKARMNYLMKEIIKVVPIILVLILVFKTYGIYSLALLIYPFIISHFRYHASGWNILNQQLTLRYRIFLKHTVYMRKNRIQSIERSSTWFQKRKYLASIQSTVKSTGIGRRTSVHFLSEADVNTIYQWYLPN